jgi:hypothetical protein
MYLMYVDESGDTGVSNSPTNYFVLSALIVHELRWATALDRMVAFRRRMRDKFGLKMSDELHAAGMINKPGDLVRIRRNDRLTILRALVDELAQIPDVNMMSIVFDKRRSLSSEVIFDRTWQTLIQRFENTLAHRNFPVKDNQEDRGLIVCDKTDERLNRLLRRMRRYNPVPNQSGAGYRDLLLKYIVEDPVHRDSRHTYFLQAVDTIAFFLYQAVAPNAFIRKKGARLYYTRLQSIACRFISGVGREAKYGVKRLR